MALSKLEKSTTAFLCPKCGKDLEFVDGGAVQVVDGHVDYDNCKPRYNCKPCGVFYREVMNTGYYDVFTLENTTTKPDDSAANTEEAGTEPVKMVKNGAGDYVCPVCSGIMRFVEGGTVRVVNGKVDYDNVKPKYECDACEVFYREVLTSGFYLPYPQQEEDKPKPRRVKATSELVPVQLKRDANNQCTCPRCEGKMDYIEGGAVTIVNGVPNMADVLDHFICKECNSTFRRIVQTDFFQYAEH